jgi:hypothetical protein
MNLIVYDNVGFGQAVRVFVALFLFAPLVISQRVVNARAGMVYFAEGAFTVDGQTVRAARNRPPQIQPGQIAATQKGHVEILMGPDAVLWTGMGTQVRFDETSVADARVSLLAGSLMIEIKRVNAENRLRVQIGERAVEIRQVGVYRFDCMPERMRVLSGDLLLIEQSVKAIRGQEIVDGSVRTFDRRDTDELFYWSALRSLTLERDAGRPQRWKRKGESDVTHAGFGVTFPFDLGAARVKYLASSEAGLVYAVDGNSSSERRFWIGQNNAGGTRDGKAQIFLGVGIVTNLAENSTIRIIDARSWAPMIALEQGAVIVEVAESRESPVLGIRVGETITHLLSPGVYRLDAQSGTLSVYRGDSETTFNGGAIRARDGQRVNLKEPAPASLFDRREQDALFHWAADSSFGLYMSQAGFMTGWVADVIDGKAKHKVFGQRMDRRIRRTPRPLPPSN